MIKILGKIELPQQAKEREGISRTQASEQAFLSMEAKRQENIALLRDRLVHLGANPYSVDERGAIRAEIFKKSLGGFIPDDLVDNDEKYMETTEQAFIMDGRERRDGHLAEEYIFILFNKIFLGTDYLLVRTHRYDDYENGVDQLIINTKTGEVVCALDELVENKNLPEFKRNKRFSSKLKRALKKKNGFSIKYGLVFQNGKFQSLGHLRNLAFSILRVERDKFYQAITKSDFSLETGRLYDEEKELIRSITIFLKEQVKIFEKELDLSYDALNDFIRFLDSV